MYNVSMNDKLIETIQMRIIDLIPSNYRGRLGEMMVDCCSEMSRLTASWIVSENKNDSVMILKGDNVFNTDKAHEILLIKSPNNKCYAIDPTIWQFFPDAPSILVFVLDEELDYIAEVKKVYGGQWRVVENIFQVNKNLEQEYLKIVSQIVNENIKGL